ncbi:TetR/AcrR family transcriptional regulator [Arthrobacter sp. MMS18-M83]|uniref:TetR/AcrR family transcriptional regulator n=1 Tax=Arthrobacter sp. MMS18-M83 TaxID=2996261 RepID=UPI00227D1F5D|nr:TetR/AcrR family transcriptional regulator [Arthrobacter sp. MMS18-M83]WAH97588.1 TetR/AcrR family transcriptional regulator [Arthrobacter sp. MMS18-M83]
MHNKRKELGEVSRQTIIDTAARLMAEHGYDGTSMSQLAKESGLPSSSIYWHFSSKEGVLEAVMERGARHFFGAFDDPDWFAGTPSERLHQMFLRTGLSLIGDPEHAQFLQLQLMFRLNSQRHREKASHDVATAVRTEGVAFMHRWIKGAYEEYGEQVSEQIASELDEFAVAMIDGIYLTIKAGSPVTPAVLLDHAATALVGLAEDALRGINSQHT